MKKVEFPEKKNSQEQKKQEIMQKITFATLRRAQKGAFSKFPRNYGEIHLNWLKMVPD